MSAGIHPSAVVDDRADLHPSVRVEPFAVIEAGVEIGEGAVIEAHAVLRQGTRVGAKCVIGSHAVIGGLPQDLGFDPATLSGVVVGDGARIREGVTIHRSTKEGGNTLIGPNAYLMAYAHVGHDGVVGERAIIANNVMMAGFVTVGSFAFVGGGAAFHQHVRVGESAMISGMSRCSRDVPPFVMMAERDEIIGLNLVGLKRRGLSSETMGLIKKAFHQVYDQGGSLPKRAKELLGDPVFERIAEVRHFLEFFDGGKRGFAPLRRHSVKADG